VAIYLLVRCVVHVLSIHSSDADDADDADDAVAADDARHSFQQ
jgi:hypothetical protein